jgi:NitT/TauT family transport system substrate-binding protein
MGDQSAGGIDAGRLSPSSKEATLVASRPPRRGRADDIARAPNARDLVSARLLPEGRTKRTEGTQIMKILARILGQGTAAAAVGAMALVAAVPAQALDTVKFLSSNDSSCSVYPQFVGQGLGIWEELGIKIELLSTDTSVNSVAFLQNGDADIVFLDASQVVQAVDAGLPIKVIYEAYQYTSEGIVVTDDSPIQGLADLKDKTVGMAGDRDLIITVKTLDSIGETIESFNVKTVVVGDSGPVMAKALQDGTIAAFAGGSSDRAGIEAAGVKIRNITPAEVSQVPGNVFTVWGPTMEEKRDVLTRFLKGWAMAQHAGVVDTKLTASVCRTFVPEQFEKVDVGMRMMSNAIYNTQLRRTKAFGELQPDVWKKLQGPYIRTKEISKELDPATFLDASFVAAANDFTTDEIKEKVNAWKAANPDKMLP